ncbi:MAG: ribonuclease III [Candidatus Latescibacteria bacterium]|nr:ribonuclease III [Candidatus Latescibacterota bacterium]
MPGVNDFWKRIWRVFSPSQKIEQNLETLEAIIGHHFADRSLLAQALKHRSYVYAADGHGIESNERLEFLGDAVLDLVVTEYLFRSFKSKREGELTQVKSLIVSKTVLAQKGREMGLGRYMLLSREEEQAGGRDRTSIIGDAYESVLGAIYLDGGLDPSRVFVTRHLLCDVEEISANGDYLNFKSVLLEHVQREGRGHPRYYVNSEEGPDHEKIFTVEVAVGGEIRGQGQGRSKKEAQQMAAKEALRRLGAV